MSVTEAYLNRFYEDLLRDQIELLRVMKDKPDKDINKQIKTITDLMSLVIKYRDLKQKTSFL